MLLLPLLWSCKTIYQTDFIGDRTPFQERYEWEKNRLFVEYEKVWYEVVAIEGVPMDEIVKKSKAHFNVEWKHRIVQDLPKVLSFVDQYEYFDTDLTLKNKETGELKEFNFPLKSGYERYQSAQKNGHKRVDRKHTTATPEAYDFLTQRLYPMPTKEQVEKSRKAYEYYIQHDPSVLEYIPFGYFPENMEELIWVSPEEAELDLSEMEYDIKKHFSYLKLRGVDYEMALDAIRSKLGTGIHRNDFALQLKRFLAMFGDGHTRVSFSMNIYLSEELATIPFETKFVEGRVVALEKKSKGLKLYDDKHPILKSIDGIPTQELLKDIRPYFATASKGQEKDLAGRLAYYTVLLRKEYIKEGKLQSKETFDVILCDKDGDEKKYTFPIIAEKKKKAEKELSKEERELKYISHKVLKSNIGYLKISSMKKRSLFVAEMKKAMESFKNTDGMIIDVRGNGGGNRIPTLTLIPYFIDRPIVINIAARRIDKDDDPEVDESYGLERRYLHPRNSKRWNEQEKQSINRWLQTHTLNWDYNKDEFSKLHFCVISPNDEAYRYKKPVVVLMDEGGFSATDIFLGAFKGIEKVTLIGTESSGGSGYSQSFALKNTQLSFQSSRIASFKKNGDLYEGNGVIPDVYVEQKMDDISKGIDTQYQQALRFLSKE